PAPPAAPASSGAPATTLLSNAKCMMFLADLWIGMGIRIFIVWSFNCLDFFLPAFMRTVQRQD
ncbi:MAG: hypothetical protein WBP63_01525, partial [Silvibacterium sp.]